MLTYLSVIIFFGIAITNIGLVAKNFPIMIIGRFILGIGGESITASQWALILDYYNNNQIGLAMVNLQLIRHMFISSVH